MCERLDQTWHGKYQIMTLHSQINQRGMEAVTRGDFDEAIQQFHQAISADGGSADYYANLGLALLLRKNSLSDVQEAIAAFHLALHRRPILPLVWGYLGAAYSASHDDENAISYLLRGLAEPSVFVLRHLCLVYARNGRFHEAKFYAESLLSMNPDDEPAHFNRSLMLLATGDFVEGWEEFEWRSRMPEVKHRSVPIDHAIPHAKQWHGEDIRDKHLLLHAEAGIGDSLQFCRFIPDLASRCRKLTVYERPGLRGLLRAAFASDKIAICAEVPKDIDYYTLIMGSGRLLHLHNGNVDRGQYLHAPVHGWQTRLAHLPKPRVGIVWAGQTDNPVDARRSLQLEQIAPLLAVPVGWVSLQMHRAEPVCPMYDASPFITDWSDTAGVVDALDLVITVDTAVAHLAGALGKPVWLLNRFDTCWRWGTVGDRSPWYASMRIFRQPSVGDWSAVIDQAVKALRTI
jgi:hypothetical protein